MDVEGRKKHFFLTETALSAETTPLNFNNLQDFISILEDCIGTELQPSCFSKPSDGFLAAFIWKCTHTVSVFSLEYSHTVQYVYLLHSLPWICDIVLLSFHVSRKPAHL